MNRNFVIGIIIITVVVVIILITGLRDRSVDDVNDFVNGNDNGAPIVSEAERVLDTLPRQFTIEARTAVIDRQTVAQNPRAEFSQRQATTLPRQDENPVEYIERILRIRLGQEHVQEQPEFFNLSASFYANASNRLVAFVNASNFPDDSVGASEERFELTFTDNRWNMDWYGQRNFCRRPVPGNWQPADQLCP